MSYDLYFYKRKGANLQQEDISDYLNKNLTSTSESDTQWFIEDDDTEAYFSIDLNEPETDAENIEMFDSFDEFDNTNFTFNLNFLRADFFGQYAFDFFDRFIQDLDLYVLNPQSSSDPDNPKKPDSRELYNNWSAINARHSADYYHEYELEYYPPDKSNDFYEFNLNKGKLQQDLGDGYYVPKLYLFKRKADGELITLATWTEHIPCVLPPADYFLLTKRYKRFFRSIEESGLVSAQTLIQRVGHLFEEYPFKNCKIINHANAEKAKDIFNSTKIEHSLADFAERVSMDKLVNAMPCLRN